MNTVLKTAYAKYGPINQMLVVDVTAGQPDPALRTDLLPAAVSTTTTYLEAYCRLPTLCSLFECVDDMFLWLTSDAQQTDAQNMILITDRLPAALPSVAPKSTFQALVQSSWSPRPT